MKLASKLVEFVLKQAISFVLAVVTLMLKLATQIVAKDPISTGLGVGSSSRPTPTPSFSSKPDVTFTPDPDFAKPISAKNAQVQKDAIAQHKPISMFIADKNDKAKALKEKLDKEVEDFKELGPYAIKDDPSIWKKGKNDV